MQEAADEVQPDSVAVVIVPSQADAQLRKNELLILAADTGFKADVQSLIADGADVNCTDNEGTPLLHFPSAKNELDIVKLLLSKGAEMDAEDRNGQTSLHFASQDNAESVVKHLIKSGAWMDAYDVNDDTALHVAIRGGHMDSVKHLIMGGAKMDIMNGRNLTTLGEAIASGKSEIVQLLLRKGASVQRTANGYSFLHLAAGIGNVDMLELLLKELSPETVVHPGGVTPLHCTAGKLVPSAVVRLLIDAGADPHASDKDGKSPLDWAKDAGNEDADVLKMLSIGERKKSSRRRRKSEPITEIEPADGPEAEWNAFQRMSHEEKLKQVEVWARSKDEYLTSLAFLDDESRKAIALVSTFMRMMECRLAIESLKDDSQFQEDAVDPHVQKAIIECTEHPQSIRKYVQSDHNEDTCLTTVV